MIHVRILCEGNNEADSTSILRFIGKYKSILLTQITAA